MVLLAYARREAESGRERGARRAAAAHAAEHQTPEGHRDAACEQRVRALNRLRKLLRRHLQAAQKNEKLINL